MSAERKTTHKRRKQAPELVEERSVSNLEQELVAATKGRKIELPVAEIRRKGLVAALRERARRRH